MTEIDPSLIASLLTDAELARNERILSNAKADFQLDVDNSEAADWSTLLGNEATKLNNRMRFLHKHPRLIRALGGSSIKVKGLWDGTSYYAYSTPVLFETGHESIGDNDVKSGYMFSTGDPELASPYAITQELVIQRAVREVNSRVSKHSLLYGIEFNPEDNSVKYVRGEGFGLSEFSQRNPGELPEVFTIEAISLLSLTSSTLGCKE